MGNKGIKPINQVLFWGIVGVFIMILFLAGTFLSRTSIDIADCHGEWSAISRNIESPLCPEAGKPCASQPFVDQHNAIVDTLLCACGKAKQGNAYPNVAINDQITSSWREHTGQSVSVNDVCEGGVLVKWRYG